MFSYNNILLFAHSTILGYRFIIFLTRKDHIEAGVPRANENPNTVLKAFAAAAFVTAFGPWWHWWLWWPDAGMYLRKACWIAEMGKEVQSLTVTSLRAARALIGGDDVTSQILLQRSPEQVALRFPVSGIRRHMWGRLEWAPGTCSPTPTTPESVQQAYNRASPYSKGRTEVPEIKEVKLCLKV